MPAIPVTAAVSNAGAHLTAAEVRAAVAAPARLVAVTTVLAAAPLASPELQSFVAMLRTTHGALVAIVSIVSPDRQTYVAIDGSDLEYTQVRDELSFCAHVVAGGQPLAVSDALLDVRFVLTPAVVERVIAAYVGVPVWIDDEVVGSLCLYGSTPGGLDASLIPTLTEHARVVSMLLDESRHAGRDGQASPPRSVAEPSASRGWAFAHWSRLPWVTGARRAARDGGRRGLASEPA